ncbi:NUDIX hydrolase [Catellatospora coxensis]
MTELPRHSVSVAGVVTDDHGRVLVIQRRDTGAWQLPGGVLELGEAIEDGMCREVLEETGVRVHALRLTGVYKNMKLGVVALVFAAQAFGGEPAPTEESAAVEWWTVAQVKERMPEAFAVRITDAVYGDTRIPRIRQHDGVNLLDAAGNAERCVTTPACEATPTPPRRNTDAKTSSRNGSAMRSPTASRLRRLPAVSPHAIGMCRNFPYEVKAARKGRAWPDLPGRRACLGRAARSPASTTDDGTGTSMHGSTKPQHELPKVSA